MVRRGLRQPVSQKLPQRQGVRALPRDRSLRRQPFKESHKYHPRVRPGRNRRSPQRLREDLLLLDQPLDKRIEPVTPEKLVQPPVEEMPLTSRQLARGHPQGRLIATFPASHRHRASLQSLCRREPTRLSLHAERIRLFPRAANLAIQATRPPAPTASGLSPYSHHLP